MRDGARLGYVHGTSLAACVLIWYDNREWFTWGEVCLCHGKDSALWTPGESFFDGARGAHYFRERFAVHKVVDRCGVPARGATGGGATVGTCRRDFVCVVSLTPLAF